MGCPPRLLVRESAGLYALLDERLDSRLPADSVAPMLSVTHCRLLQQDRRAATANADSQRCTANIVLHFMRQRIALQLKICALGTLLRYMGYG